MYDRGLSVLEQYGLEAHNTRRGRGAIICETREGCVQIREFSGSERRLEYQAEILKAAEKAEDICVDTILANQEGKYISVDKDNIAYTVRKWYEGKECDTKSLKDIRRGAAALASLHKTLKMPVQRYDMSESLISEYERHNRELRKVRKFVCQKRQKNNFELRFLDSAACYLWHGEEALRKLKSSGYDELRSKAFHDGSVCHGECNQHNILMLQGKTCVTNFEKWGFDVQTGDLYQFMRKILEKNDWNPAIGKEMLLAYHERKPLSDAEWENLKIRFLYPEKYWKLTNQYYNRRKAWVSEKNLEKLEKLIAQHERWMEFVENMAL